MAMLNLSRKIIIRLAPAQAKSLELTGHEHQFGPGMSNVPDALADHPYVKAHTIVPRQIKPGAPRPQPLPQALPPQEQQLQAAVPPVGGLVDDGKPLLIDGSPAIPPPAPGEPTDPMGRALPPGTPQPDDLNQDGVVDPVDPVDHPGNLDQQGTDWSSMSYKDLQDAYENKHQGKTAVGISKAKLIADLEGKNG